jgi:hypothetical protein
MSKGSSNPFLRLHAQRQIMAGGEELFQAKRHLFMAHLMQPAVAQDSASH